MKKVTKGFSGVLVSTSDVVWAMQRFIIEDGSICEIRWSVG